MNKEYRIVFLAVNDEFSGYMQKFIYEKYPQWVVGSVISKNAIYKKNMFQAIWFVIKNSGLFYFLQMIRIKILKLLFSKDNKDTALSLAQKHNKEVYHSSNINSNEDIDRINQWQPDLVISTNFSHYVGKNARNFTRYGTWNLHKSYLPDFRGMAPSFYALLEGKEHVGVTLHVIDKGFDTGPIITQKKIPIENDDTVYTLNCKTSEQGGKMLLEYLENIDLDQFTTQPQPEDYDKYYTYPNRKDIGLFREKGLFFDKVS